MFKSPIMRGQNGDELRLDTAGRAEWKVVHSDPKLYALWLIREDERVDWPTARELYRTYWSDAFGEQAVVEAAAKVRAAPKTLRYGREALKQEIAGQQRPAAALAKLMPHHPYRDRPLGSLQSRDPQAYVYALLMGNGVVPHWNEAPVHYQQLQLDWGEKTLLDAAKQVIDAAKDAQGDLSAPKELGVTTSDPWQALQELLKQSLTKPDRFFYRLARTASTGKQTAEGDRQSAATQVDAEYKHLVESFGREKVERAIGRVREAVESESDLAKLSGNSSGSRDPLPAFYEVLWSSASPQEFLQYLSPTRNGAQAYFDRYGREATLAVVEKLMKAKKQPESLERAHFDRGGVAIADPGSLGLSPPKGSGGAAYVSCPA